MKLEDDFCGKEYIKITLVCLSPDKCSILKGPEEEKDWLKSCGMIIASADMRKCFSL